MLIVSLLSNYLIAASMFKIMEHILKRKNGLRVYFSGMIKLISRFIFYKQKMSQSVLKYS